MKNIIIGLLIIIIGLILAIYVGVWVLFVGGIAQIIEGFKNNIDALTISLGVVRIMASSFCGWLIGGVGFLLGKFFIDEA